LAQTAIFQVFDVRNGGYPPFFAFGTRLVTPFAYRLDTETARHSKGANIMFNIDLRQIAAAAVGALLLSTACVGAAIGPVQTASVETSRAA
jgi:hypothetical protein